MFAKGGLSLAVVLTAALGIVLTGIQPRAAHADDEGDQRVRGQFTATSSNNFPPVNTIDHDGQLTGFGVELARAVIKATGGTVRHIHSDNWTEVMANLTTGRADFIHDTGFTPERAMAFDFTDPILEMPEQIFVAPDQFSIYDIDSLSGRPTACVNNHISHLYLQRFPNIRCVVVDTPMDGVRALIEGKVDAFVYPRQIVLFLAQRADVIDKIKAVGEPLRLLTWHMTVRKGDVPMLARLNKGIAKIKADGTYDRIYEKWFGRTFLEGYSAKEVTIIAAVGILVSVLGFCLLFLFIYSLSLRRRRNELQRLVREKEQAQEMLGQFFDLSQGMLCIAGFDGYFKQLSRSWQTTLGYTEAELLAAPFIEFVHPDDRDATVREAASIAQGGITGTFENRYRTRNGEYRWILWQALRAPSHDLIYASAMDITERKRHEQELTESKRSLENRVVERTQALSESEARFKAIADYTYDWESWIGEDGTLRWVNPAVQRITGYAPDECYGLDDFPLSLVASWDRERIGEAVANAIHGQSARNLEFQIVGKEGAVVPVSASFQPLLDEEGGFQGSRWSIQDTSLRKDAEARAHALMVRLETLVNTSPAVIYTCRPDGDFGATYISPNITRQIGYTPEQFTGNSSFWSENIHPDDRERVFSELDALFAKGSHSHEYRFKFADGRYRWMHDDLTLRRDEDGTAIEIVGTWIDIDQRKRAEEAANAANEAKSQFLASMSHELRTPLNAILGFGQLLRIDTDNPLNENQTGQLDHMLRGGEHLLGLIDEVLDLAKIEAGKLALSLETVRSAEVVSVCAEMIQNLAKAHNITLRNQIKADEIPNIHADYTRLRQVLLNLLSNAVKYNRPNGDVTIRARQTAADFLRLEVVDTGPGIPLDKQADVFKPFSRLGMEARGIEGTGIGLALTRRIVEHMGGRIGFESTPGQGSTFWIDLQLSQDDPNAADSLSQPGAASHDDRGSTSTSTPGPNPGPGPGPGSGSGNIHVLYVEDNPANVSVMEGVFGTLPGYHLEIAMTGLEALEAARRTPPHLILMDIDLPDMTGIEAFHRLRAGGGMDEVPVIAVSANALKDEINAVLAEGFRGYLTKPFKIADVTGMVVDMTRDLVVPA